MPIRFYGIVWSADFRFIVVYKHVWIYFVYYEAMALFITYRAYLSKQYMGDTMKNFLRTFNFLKFLQVK